MKQATKTPSHYGIDPEFDRWLESRMRHEILCCVSNWADALGQAGELDDENGSNFYSPRCPKCGDSVLLDAAWTDESDDLQTAACNSCEWGGDVEEANLEPQEVFEYWAVTAWLAEELEALGHVIWETSGPHVWGRTCTGQSWILDGWAYEIASKHGWKAST